MPPTDLSVLQIRRDGDEDSPRRRGRIWLALVVLLAIAAGGWLAWRSEWLPSSAPEVRVARPRLIQPGGAEEVLTATGYIVPQLRSVVSARISGRLDWLGVDEG